MVHHGDGSSHGSIYRAGAAVGMWRRGPSRDDRRRKSSYLFRGGCNGGVRKWAHEIEIDLNR